ncbi:MAG: tyrosine-protein phosphatase [Clostridia bacterium]|nr:tyrosine-protein phosphatase [Clostridia bacterium]
MIELLYPADKERICIHTQVIKDFIYHNGAGHHYNNREREDVYSWLREYYDGRYTGNYKNNPDELNLTRSQTVSFAWRSSVPCKLVISPCHDFSTTCLDYPASPECCEIVYKGEYDGVFHAEADQLFSDTDYYWKIVAEDGSEESVPRSFVTFGGYPRFIFAEGTANFRDLGGLATYDGKRTRQGCVYRCAALDSEIESNYDLTERGTRVLRDIVKLRCELDIRREAFGVKKSSVLGDSVKYLQIIGRGYDYFFLPEEKEGRRRLVEALADENNYPICFHCAGGADRTGTLALFILALLGVPRSLIELDYNITTLTVVDKRKLGTWSDYDNFLVGYEGGDITEYVKGSAEKYYLEQCGGDADTLNRLRNNLLEDVTL